MELKISNWLFIPKTSEPENGSWKFNINSRAKTIDVYFEGNIACAIYAQTSSETLTPTVDVIKSFLHEIKKLYPNGF